MLAARTPAKPQHTGLTSYQPDTQTDSPPLVLPDISCLGPHQRFKFSSPNGAALGNTRRVTPTPPAYGITRPLGNSMTAAASVYLSPNSPLTLGK